MLGKMIFLEKYLCCACLVIMLFFGRTSYAACTTAGVVTTCDSSIVNPWPNTVGAGNDPAADGQTVIVGTGSFIDVGDKNAISLRDHSTITIKGGAVVRSTGVANNGLYAHGANTIEFRNDNTVNIEQYGKVLADGTQLKAEAINILGVNNWITNNGIIDTANSHPIWIDASSGTNTIVNNETGEIIAGLGSGNAIGFVPFSLSSIDFTNKGKVFSNLVFSGGDDVLRLYTGSFISGFVNGGAGTNQLFLNGLGQDSLANAISNFQILTKADAGTWTLNNAFAGFQTVDVLGGTLAVGDSSHATASLAAGNVTISPGATLGGYGSVSGTVVNNGTIAVADAVSAFSGDGSGVLTITGSLGNGGTLQVGGAGVGNQLKIEGNYSGAGGSLAINTELGADNSPSDRLVVSNGTASGTTVIRVTNLGGAGALTTGDGIEVVSTANSAITQSGAFNLAAPVVAGPYEYSLYRGGSANPNAWYLRSIEVLGTSSRPNYRKEVSLYSAIPSMTQLYSRSALDTLHERMGGDVSLGNPFEKKPYFSNAIWVRGFGQHGDQDTDDYGIYGKRGPAFRFDIVGLQLGADLFRDVGEDNSDRRAGVYFSSGRISGRVKHVDGTDAGNNVINANTFGIYWTAVGGGGAYLDFVANATRYDIAASPARMSGMSTQARSLASSIEVGYPLAISGNWFIEPQAQVIYQRTGFSRASDVAALIQYDNLTSLLGRIGVRLSRHMNDAASMPYSVWGRINLWREFNGRAVTEVSSSNGFVPFSSRLPETLVELSGGLTVRLSRSSSFYASSGYQVGASRDLHALNAKAGIYWTW